MVKTIVMIGFADSGIFDVKKSSAKIRAVSLY